MMNDAATNSTSVPPAGQPEVVRDPLPLVRQTVRSLLLSSPAFRELDDEQKKQMAAAMVKVCHAAASMVREEMQSDEQVAGALSAERENGAFANDLREDAPAAPLATTQGFGDAANRVAGTTRSILNAVSFPRFVTELINGVFKAIVDSSQQQMHGYVELLNNVAASLDGFAGANYGPDRARQWLAERYPGSFEIIGEVLEGGSRKDPNDDWETDEDESGGELTLRLRPGASPPPPETLRVDLGLGQNETIPTGDPERTLVPLVRRALARQRQQMLATMVMMGMQRIVIDAGRITASMRFHIDTRSALNEDKASRFDFQHQSSGAASYGGGPWGVSASMTNTIGYVNTQRTQTTEELNTELDLNSSVELNFRTDYLPLDRMTGDDRAKLIRANSLNPETEARLASEAARERQSRRDNAATREASRRTQIDTDTRPRQTPRATPGAPGTVEHAERARREAQTRERQSGSGGQPSTGGTGGDQSGSARPSTGGTGGGQSGSARPSTGGTGGGQSGSARPST